jgi:hypothetical protein
MMTAVSAYFGRMARFSFRSEPRRRNNRVGGALRLSILAADFCPSPKKAQPPVQGQTPAERPGFWLGVPAPIAAKRLDPLGQIHTFLGSEGEAGMQYNEQEFCRDQSIRLLKLAKECPDPQTRDHLIVMANEWLERADETDRLAKSA